MAMRRQWMTDATLRLSGALLLATVWFAGRALLHSPALVQRHDPGLRDFALATWLVLATTGGTVLLTLGAHIFDQVEISPRWARSPTPER